MISITQNFDSGRVLKSLFYFPEKKTKTKIIFICKAYVIEIKSRNFEKQDRFQKYLHFCIDFCLVFPPKSKIMNKKRIDEALVNSRETNSGK